MTAWQKMTPEEVEQATGSDGQRGLTEREAAFRLKKGKNRPFLRKRSGVWERVLRRSFFLPLLMLVSGIALFIGGDRVAGYVTVFSLLFHLAALLAAELRAVRVMEEAGESSAPAAKVIRNGHLLVVPAEDLVPGDVILLSAGDHIPADGRLLYTSCFRVLERGITSQDRVAKDANAKGSDRPEDSLNMVFAGCVVEEGFARVMVVETGMSTLLAATKQAGQELSLEETPFMKRLKKLSSLVSIGLLGFVFLMTVLSLLPFVPFDFPAGWTLACALAAGAMAEFYPTFALITAGNGVFGALAWEKKITEGAVIRRAGALPTLASVDRLILPPSFFCVEDSLCVARLVLPDRTVVPLYGVGDGAWADGSGSGGATLPGAASEAVSGRLPSGARFLLRNVLFAMAPAFSPDGKSMGPALRPEDPVLTKKRQLLMKFAPLVRTGAGERTYLSLGGGITSDGLSFGLISHGEDFFLTVAGSVEAVTPFCGLALAGKKILPLDDKGRSALLAFCCKDNDRPTQITAAAYGAVSDGLALLEDPPTNGTALWARFAHPPVFEGFVVFEERLSPTAQASLKDAGDAGIALTLAADSDYDRSVAYLLGFDADSLYFSHTLEAGLGDREALVASLSRREKAELIDRYQAQGETVAYLGKDFSHIACMKRADAAISVGRTLASGARVEVPPTAEPGESPIQREQRHLPDSACDAIRQGADIIVAPASPEGQGGFFALTEALLRARTLFYNTRDILRYLTFSLGFRLVLTLITFFSGVTLVTPMVLTLFGTVADLLAVAALTFRRPRGKALFAFRTDGGGRRWVFPLWGILSGGLAGLLLFLLCPRLALPAADVTVLLVGMAAIALLAALMGFGAHRLFAYRATAALLLGALTLFFFVRKLSWMALPLPLGFAAAVLAGTRLASRLSDGAKKRKSPEKRPGSSAKREKVPEKS